MVLFRFQILLFMLQQASEFYHSVDSHVYATDIGATNTVNYHVCGNDIDTNTTEDVYVYGTDNDSNKTKDSHVCDNEIVTSKPVDSNIYSNDGDDNDSQNLQTYEIKSDTKQAADLLILDTQNYSNSTRSSNDCDTNGGTSKLTDGIDSQFSKTQGSHVYSTGSGTKKAESSNQNGCDTASQSPLVNLSQVSVKPKRLVSCRNAGLH